MGRVALVALVAAVAGCGGAGGGAGLDAGWTPPEVVEDLPFVQEIAEARGALTDVRAVALDASGVCHAATADGVQRWNGTAWEAVPVPLAGGVVDLAFAVSGELAVVGPAGAALGAVMITLPAGAPPTFVGPRAAGGVWVAGPDYAGAWDGSWTALPLAGARAVVDGPDGWYAATAAGVVSAAATVTMADGLPADDVRTLAVLPDGTVAAGTAAGLARRDPGTGAWRAVRGADGLHYGDLTRLAVAPDGALVAATPMGASVYAPGGGRRYYFGRAWLPADAVRGAVRAADGTLWVATAAGVGVVRGVTTTLAERAARYDRLTQERHVRLGYTSTECGLAVAGDLTTAATHDDDNDGEWTGMYLASQAFRFAVTGAADAQENARVAAAALRRLEQVTGAPGFFARSVVPGAECPGKQAGAGEWHLSADGAWCWKGDTSSDELVGHVFGLSVYHDLAATAAERAAVAAALGRIVGRIVDCGYVLCDVDGQPTTDGHFDPEWMESSFQARYGDAGLNAAMILGALRAAEHVTGEARFGAAAAALVRDHGYAEYVRRIEEINLSIQVNHDSEEMSFLALFALLRYERDPALLAIWREGLEHLWQVQRPERDPELNVMHAAMARPAAYDLAASVETLRALPESLVLWGLDSSHRWDRDEDPQRDRFGQPQNRFVFPYGERQPMRWCENPYAYRQPGDGHAELSGTFWLLPYWMARYYGLIR
ncbi:MAG TPA: hypothetical protein VGQ83_14805 [Polyangia bacterium]|jgi:hypothetical protein